MPIKERIIGFLKFFCFIAILRKLAKYWQFISFCFNWSRFCQSRHQRHLFLFYGLRHSGKSTAIQHIFDVKNPLPGHEASDSKIMEYTSKDKKSRIIEVPGYHSKPCTERNQEILTSVFKYIAHKYEFRISPTIIFITAQLNDQRFSGGSSEFTNLLNSLFCLKIFITGEQWSNIVLLLTHADRPDIQRAKLARIDEYKNAFRSVFGVTPLCLVIGNEPISIDQIEKQMLSSTNSCRYNGFHLLLLSYLRSGYKKYVGEYIDAANFSESNPMSNKIPHCLETGRVLEDPICDDIRTKLNQIVELSNCVTINVEDGRVYNFLSRTSRILVAKNKSLPISECTIGQRVVTLNSGTGIISNIFPFVDLNIFSNQIVFGKLFMGCRNNVVQLHINLGGSFVKFKDLNRHLMHVTINKDNCCISGRILFFVEVDGGTSEIIEDNTLLASQK